MVSDLRTEDVARFWGRVAGMSDDECWPWPGEVKANGYGRFDTWMGGRRHWYVHRVAYELTNGPIPEGYDVDHVCHNEDTSCDGGPACLHRRCCNPLHLRAVSRATNLAAGRGSSRRPTRSQCSKGHPFSPENTYRLKDGSRVCRTCSLAYQAARRRRAA